MDGEYKEADTNVNATRGIRNYEEMTKKRKGKVERRKNVKIKSLISL